MIEIQREDIEIILQEDYVHFEKVIQNCFCGHCSHHLTTIIAYKAYLNSLQDILLKGQCARCGHPVNRYLETGENKNHAAIAQHIQMIIKKYKVI